jgi:hypothetical protein
MKIDLGVITLCFAILFFTACSKNDNNGTNEYRMSLYLTDDPTIFDQVNLDIEQVYVKATTDVGDSGWISLNIKRPGVYNLLNFSNGMDTLLAENNISIASIAQVKLIFGTNNSVIVGGTAYPLQLTSDVQAGFTLQANYQLTVNTEFRLWLDFDLARSIIGSGTNFTLVPFVRTYTKDATGSVKGIVLPVTAHARVYALTSTSDTAASAIPNSVTGMFVIQGLNAGTYTISVRGYNGYNTATYNNVSVSNMQESDIGTVTLLP